MEEPALVLGGKTFKSFNSLWDYLQNTSYETLVKGDVLFEKRFGMTKEQYIRKLTHPTESWQTKMTLKQAKEMVEIGAKSLPYQEGSRGMNSLKKRNEYRDSIASLFKKEIPKADSSHSLGKDVQVFRAPRQESYEGEKFTGVYTTPQKEYAKKYKYSFTPKMQTAIVPAGSKILKAQDIDTLSAQMFGKAIPKHGLHEGWINNIRTVEARIAKKAKSLGYDAIYYEKESYDMGFSERAKKPAVSYVILDRNAYKPKNMAGIVVLLGAGGAIEKSQDGKERL